MTSFFDRMLGRNTKGSSSTAKDRLQFVLVHDRINLPPERMREMKEEILAVISKYVSVDRDSVDIALEQRDRRSKIVAEIPFSQEMRQKVDIDEDEDLSKPRLSLDLSDDSAIPPAPAKSSEKSAVSAQEAPEASAAEAGAVSDEAAKAPESEDSEKTDMT